MFKFIYSMILASDDTIRTIFIVISPTTLNEMLG